MEDEYCLGSTFLVHSSFRFVLRLGSTNSRGSGLAVCILHAFPVQEV